MREEAEWAGMLQAKFPLPVQKPDGSEHTPDITAFSLFTEAKVNEEESDWRARALDRVASVCVTPAERFWKIWAGVTMGSRAMLTCEAFERSWRSFADMKGLA
jgi:hypothetical protein